MASVISIATKALQEAIKAVVDTINTNVGAKTDIADAAGSLHAKVKTANDRIGAINPEASGTDTLFKYDRKIFDRVDEQLEPFSFVDSVSLTTEWTVVRDITGRSGYLLSAGVLSNSADRGIYIRITMDGLVVFYGSTSSSTTGTNRGPCGIMYTPAELRRRDYAYSSDPAQIYARTHWQGGNIIGALQDNMKFNPDFPSSSQQPVNSVLLNAMPIRFNFSLKIEHRVGSGSGGYNVIHTGALVK